MFSVVLMAISLIGGLAVEYYEHRNGLRRGDSTRRFHWGFLLIVCGFIGSLFSYKASQVELYPTDGIVSKDGEVVLETDLGLNIYYTLNAKEDPSENGILYEGPIKIEKETVLNAKSNFGPFWGPRNSWILLADEYGRLYLDTPNTPLSGDEVIDISVEYKGGDIEVGDTPNRDDFLVKEILSDGTERAVNNFSIDEGVLSRTGVSKLKIVYKDFVKYCEVTVVNPPKLEVTFQVGDVEVGDVITNDMFSVLVVNSDGTREEVKDFTISPQEFSEPGIYTITIEYEEMQATCNITVEEAFVSEVWESHTPDDAATFVSMVAWDSDDDYGITGKRYSGGQKITVSNAFSDMGSSFEEEIESTYFISVRNRDEEATFDGIIVLDQSMLNSSSHGTISIEVDGQELFTTGDIGADDQVEYPFSVPYKDVDTIRLITRATLIKSNFVYGCVNAD